MAIIWFDTNETEQQELNRVCPYCGRIMSIREAQEQKMCNHCVDVLS